MKLNDDIIKLFTLFNNAGYKLYIIGGAVRDYLLNRTIEDYDFATDATPEEMILILDGYQLDTFQASLGSVKVHLKNKIYEITTFRKEVGVKDYRYPNQIQFVKSLGEDVLRRDFTINALAYSITDGIIDLVNGLVDLKEKNIKFIKDSFESIKEDPIRLIRALRFSLLLGFRLQDDDLNVFKELSSNVSYLGQIRYDELLKLFRINDCKKHLLKYFAIYKSCYPELFDERFKVVLNSNISNDLLKYILWYFNHDVKFMFTKCDKLILQGLSKIDTNKNDLYYTKLLMIEYKESLADIILILAGIGKDVSHLETNINIIKTEHHCLDIKELKISYLDLEALGIEKKYFSKILKFLLNEVLKDYSLNDKEHLIKLVKEKKGGF